MDNIHENEVFALNIFNRLYNKLRQIRPSGQCQPEKNSQEKFSKNLQENTRILKNTLGNSDDVIIRNLQIINGVDAIILYIDGMADQTFVSENIIQPLLSKENPCFAKGPYSPDMLENIKNMVLTACEVKDAKDLKSLISSVLAGDTALFLEGSNVPLVISSRGFKNRGVQEPQTEVVSRGPREGFSEPLTINTSLIRRRINNPNLRLETFSIGRQTQTKICIAYLAGVCNPKFVEELRKRIGRIDTDAIFGAGYIEQFIEDAPNSLFTTIGHTERPDVAAAKIIEGRIAIITDGTPIVLTIPFLFVEAFQSPEDYLLRPFFSSLIRGVRFLSFLITIYLPAIYIALTTFHQEMIPTQLLITMAAAREGVPFPAVVEAIGMGVTFEFIREAGIRMPRPVGQAVSIVGALVIGQAAVQAGLVSAPMVIITSLTAITIFIVPMLLDVATLMRLAITIAAGVAGLYGIILSTMVFVIHVLTLRSLGVPYLSPLAPLNLKDLKDVLIRAPIWADDTRPRVIGFYNRKKQKDNLKPEPPE